MVPTAADRIAGEEADHCTRGGGGYDVADGEEAYFAVGGLWRKAQVEEEHGELGEGVADPAEHGHGVADLQSMSM